MNYLQDLLLRSDVPNWVTAILFAVAFLVSQGPKLWRKLKLHIEERNCKNELASRLQNNVRELKKRELDKRDLVHLLGGLLRKENIQCYFSYLIADEYQKNIQNRASFYSYRIANYHNETDKHDFEVLIEDFASFLDAFFDYANKWYGVFDFESYENRIQELENDISHIPSSKEVPQWEQEIKETKEYIKRAEKFIIEYNRLSDRFDEFLRNAQMDGFDCGRIPSPKPLKNRYKDYVPTQREMSSTEYQFKPLYISPGKIFPLSWENLIAGKKVNIHLTASLRISLWILDPDQRKIFEKSGMIITAKKAVQNQMEIVYSFTPDESGLWGFLIKNLSETDVAKVKIKDWSLEG